LDNGIKKQFLDQMRFFVLNEIGWTRIARKTSLSRGIEIVSKPMPSTGKTGQPAFPRFPPNQTCCGPAKMTRMTASGQSYGNHASHQTGDG
jgi:hypothetical protein